MPTLHIMRGLPACGKSTRAEAIVRESGNCVRVNKDLLRTMLHFGKWTGRNEKTTHHAARLLVKELLGHTSVVVDDTNLNESVMQGWKDLGHQYAKQVQVHDMTHVPVDQCIHQNNGRAEKNGVDRFVIANTALRYRLHKFSPDSVVLCDVDGTIADIEHRLHYLQQNKKDWDGFFGAASRDVPRSDVRLQVIEALYGEHKKPLYPSRTLVYVSARPERYRESTATWLQSHVRLPFFTLLMRRDGDRRDDQIVKAEILDAHFPDLGVIHKVFDDRPRVIRMWRERGLEVVDVGGGVEF